MGYSIIKILVSGCLSFIMATSGVNGYGIFSNMYVETVLEAEAENELNTDTATEMIVEEKEIDSDHSTEPVKETESKEEIVQTVEKVEEPKPVEEEIKTPTIVEQPKEQQEQQEQQETSGNKVSLGTYKLTAYCPCSKCCGKWAGGNTSSGTVPTQGRTVACNSLSAGTKININGHDYIVEDTGNMRGNVIDIFFNNHQEALNFGVRYSEVFVYNN